MKSSGHMDGHRPPVCCCLHVTAHNCHYFVENRGITFGKLWRKGWSCETKYKSQSSPFWIYNVTVIF